MIIMNMLFSDLIKTVVETELKIQHYIINKVFKYHKTDEPHQAKLHLMLEQ